MADDKLIQEIKDRFKEAYDAVDQQHEIMLEDLRFLEGEQWPSALKEERESEGRPCLVINKLPTFADQVSGDIRQNTPAIKVKPIDSQSDVKTAEVFTGLIRNIQVQSQADIAYDTAVESAVQCGKGAFRITTEYADDDMFEQDIKIRRIKNPMTVYWDPAAQEWDKSDARYCFVTERIPKEEFEKLYPDAQVRDAEGGNDYDAYWHQDKHVRIAEYFVKTPDKKILYLLRDPFTGEQITSHEITEGLEVIKQREINTYKIMWYKTNGVEILESREWPGRYIPIVMVWGKETNIEGKTVYRGVIRHAKDPQRLYNYYRSTGAETISLAPKTPYLVTAKMIANYQSKWDQAHKRNYPYLPFDIDPAFPTVPQRSEPISMNTGIQNEVLVSDQEMHDTTGLQLASLGKASNEKSGKAIMARQREGDVANYAFYDNLVRGLTYAGRVLVNLIPKIYDTDRIVRLLNEDNTEKFVRINAPFIDPKTQQRHLYDITTGKYDVVVTIGPSYNTAREEAGHGMLAFLQALPQQAALIADKLVQIQDWPGAEEMAKRLRKALPPGLVEEDPNRPSPPQPPPPPDPQLMMDMQMHQIKIKQEEARLQGIILDNEKTKAEIDKIEAEFVVKNLQPQKTSRAS